MFEDIFIKNKDKFKTPINFTREDSHPFFAVILQKTSENDNTTNYTGALTQNLASPNGSPDEKKEVATENNSENLNRCCDEVFYEFLNFSRSKTNMTYFPFIFKFTVLFRECMNIYKNVELEIDKETLKENIPEQKKEYTQHFNAENVPDLCNEFVTEFMEKSDYFNMNSDLEKWELIELIQYFCHWLYESNYTSSRLSLLN